MKYIFCSFMFDDVENDIKASKAPNSVSGHKFQYNMLKGLLENGCEVEVINIPRIRRYPDYRKIRISAKPFLFSGEKKGVSVGFINLLGLNYLTQISAVYKNIKKIISRQPDVDYTLLVYNTYPAPTFAARRARRKFKNTIICDVIGDIFGKYGLSPEKGIYGKLVDLLHNKMDKMASECDAFALATENMAEALEIKAKPHIVIEGMYAAEESSTYRNNDDGNKRIFYAGALLKEYGIEHLLNAFSLIREPDFRLVIAGGGDAAETVRLAAESDNRIEYLGFITPSEVRRQQDMATVLVNPRQSGLQYIKYSFASKNLECLASGVPYIAHDLPCNPPEYADYIFYPENETDEAFAKKIMEVCAMSTEERQDAANRAVAFIRREKNPENQMKKLDAMIQSIGVREK